MSGAYLQFWYKDIATSWEDISAIGYHAQRDAERKNHELQKLDLHQAQIVGALCNAVAYEELSMVYVADERKRPNARNTTLADGELMDNIPKPKSLPAWLICKDSYLHEDTQTIMAVVKEGVPIIIPHAPFAGTGETYQS